MNYITDKVKIFDDFEGSCGTKEDYISAVVRIYPNEEYLRMINGLEYDENNYKKVNIKIGEV